MNVLLEQLDPAEIKLKGRLVAAFFENPFLEASGHELCARFTAAPEAMETALADLCGCGVLENLGRLYRFSAGPQVYGAAAELAQAHQGEDAAVRQRLLELETFARLQEDLKVTRHEVGAVLDMVPAGVLILDRYGHLLKSNALGRDLLALSMDGVRADVCGLLGLDLETVLAQEVHIEVELSSPLAVNSRPFRVPGSEAGAVVSVQDITDRRAVEARAEQMREAFFSMIRHELRKPLLTVDRCLSMLETGGEATPETRDMARRATAHLTAMVDDMLFLARLERDPMAVRLRDGVSLRFLLVESDLAYRVRAVENGVKLRLVPPEEDVLFRGDEGRLGQVVGNLVDNAIKFTPRSGTVLLSGGREGNGIWVRVADTGPGIPAAERERVFGKFYQMRDDEGRTVGLGLGLAICRQVVLAHSGTIEVGEQPEGGSVFTVRLPLDGLPPTGRRANYDTENHSGRG